MFFKKDGETKPPNTSGKRQAGRPKKKRLCKRSKFADPVKESTVRCSICKVRGHPLSCYARQHKNTTTTIDVLDLLL